MQRFAESGFLQDKHSSKKRVSWVPRNLKLVCLFMGLKIKLNANDVRRQRKTGCKLGQQGEKMCEKPAAAGKIDAKEKI